MSAAAPLGPPLEAAALRQAAEQRLAQRPVTPADGLADALHLFHELQVHQIELQLQNEALQLSETEARQAVQGLVALRGRLEQEVVDRTAALVSAREAADAANHAKSLFLSNMSHELRTPLNGVMGMIGLALGRATDPRQIDWLQKANSSAAHLLSIINDVLDLAKIEADKLTLVQVDFRLGSVLDLLVDLLTGQATGKGVGFSVDIDPPQLAGQHLLGDAQRLRQVLLNLAGNAVKFTDVGSVCISVSQVQAAHDELLLRFEVRDTGLGISPDDLGRLFKEFAQVDNSSTRLRGGTGLGLAICKRLVEAMRGEIGVESVPGVGSTFWFTARFGVAEAQPVRPSLPEAAAPLARLIDEFTGTSVLLVEDNPINQQLMRALLEQAGLAVSVADNGAIAVAAARAAPFALILMDLHMPELDGIAATRAIRVIPGYAHTPIVALTSSAFDEDRQRCLEAGMDDHIAKPIAAADLFGAMLKWLRARPVRAGGLM
jgi:signal transduction histidine kinase/ActR/RegA family two-component response regulator